MEGILRLLAIGWNKESIFSHWFTVALGFGFGARNLVRKRNPFVLLLNWILRISNVRILLLGYNLSIGWDEKGVTLNMGTYGRLHMTKKTPIESWEPFVQLDFTGTAPTPQSPPFILMEQTEDNISTMAGIDKWANNCKTFQSYFTHDELAGDSGKRTSFARTLANVAFRSDPLNGVVAYWKKKNEYIFWHVWSSSKLTIIS